MKIVSNTEFTDLGNGNLAKNLFLEDAENLRRRKDFSWDHVFGFFKSDLNDNILPSGLFTLKFYGRYGVDPKTSNITGTYTDGETQEVPVLDENGDPALDENGDPIVNTVLVEKNLVLYILNGGDYRDDPNPEFIVVKIGWADYNSVKYYFDNNSETLEWSPDMARDVLTAYGMIGGKTEAEIAAIQEILLAMAQQAVLEHIKINGQSIKDLGFTFE